ASSNSININTNTSWSISKNVSWITLDTTIGSNNRTVSFSVANNDSSSSRLGKINISAAGCDTKTLIINQKAYDTLNLKKGWQTLAFPYRLDNHSFERLKTSGRAWIYNNGEYVEIESVPSAGIGFWYYAPKATSLLISGDDADIPKLNMGWNLISPAVYSEFASHGIMVFSPSDNTYVLSKNSIDRFGMAGWLFIREMNK
ncbi:MAG: BACON domain-containing protein, partial [Victivallales bacterium]|nr:BACON domain-containing protein [Victivallales bacterium]